jgi:hypothetical protein
VRTAEALGREIARAERRVAEPPPDEPVAPTLILFGWPMVRLASRHPAAARPTHRGLWHRRPSLAG